MINDSFINCYIFEVKQWPRSGTKFDMYTLADIYHYNSLTDYREDKQLSPYIQIPETHVKNVNMKLLLSNKYKIIKNNLAIIKRIDDDNWEINYDNT